VVMNIADLQQAELLAMQPEIQQHFKHRTVTRPLERPRIGRIE
jgi:hypothetical protein